VEGIGHGDRGLTLGGRATSLIRRVCSRRPRGNWGDQL